MSVLALLSVLSVLFRCIDNEKREGGLYHVPSSLCQHIYLPRSSTIAHTRPHSRPQMCWFKLYPITQVVPRLMVSTAVEQKSVRRQGAG